jgi:tetratricopeptide (TPR) repeat protein
MEIQRIELERSSAMATSSRRWRLVLPVILIAAILSVGGWRSWQVWQYQNALAQVNAQMAAGRHAVAARNLVSLLAWKPGSDEAIYLLGVCERARGRADAAAEAWARVPPDSPFWGQAIQGRTDLKIDRGLLGDAEQLIKLAQHDAPDQGSILNALLAPIYSREGRFEEAARLIEEEWDGLNQKGKGASANAIHLLRWHMDMMRTRSYPETTRAYFEKAASVSPIDDRVSLARAHLAIRDGRFDEAAHLLDDCLRSRPDDVPVWRAKLNWALETKQLATVLEALKHLPADQSTPAHTHKMAAWIARQHGDIEPERRALERLIEADPADLSALTRLAELAEKAGQPERSAELGRQKNEIEQLQARYQKLHDRNQPIRDAVEMARLAAKLGLGFEARAFLTIAVAAFPRRSDLRDELRRLSPLPGANATSGRTLEQVIAPELKALADPALGDTNAKADGNRLGH